MFLASVGENDYGEADDESGNQGGEPFWESIEHGGDDPTLEFERSLIGSFIGSSRLTPQLGWPQLAAFDDQQAQVQWVTEAKAVSNANATD